MKKLCVYKYIRILYIRICKILMRHCVNTQEYILRRKCSFCLRNSKRLQRCRRAGCLSMSKKVAAECSREGLWNGNLMEAQWAWGSGGIWAWDWWYHLLRQVPSCLLSDTNSALWVYAFTPFCRYSNRPVLTECSNTTHKIHNYTHKKWGHAGTNNGRRTKPNN